jgi:octaprenyl-diphosphate synthase
VDFFVQMSLSAQEITDVDPLSALKTLLQKDLKGIDQIIDHHLDSSVPLIPTLGRHLIYAGGKRLRPLLTVASYRLFQQNEGDGAVGLAAAVEFIHTATLLHDDVIDESKLRRGVPTANELWGNQASVLVGDFLFARSFQLMIAAKNPDVLRILSDAAACISEGEVLQLSLCHKLDITREDSLRIIEAKTAMLFAAACEVGALMASHKEHASVLRTYGLYLGMAFQIVDDILDYCAHEDQLGKEIGNDFREGKITLPVILTYPHCTESEKKFFCKTLIDHDQTPEDFSKALEILKRHNGLVQAYELAASYGEKAQRALEAIPENTIKSLLIELIDHCLKRQC